MDKKLPASLEEWLARTRVRTLEAVQDVLRERLHRCRHCRGAMQWLDCVEVSFREEGGLMVPVEVWACVRCKKRWEDDSAGFEIAMAEPDREVAT